MLDITIIAVGKVKTSYYAAAATEYLLRLKPYARVRVEEVAAAAFTTPDSKVKARQTEAQLLLAAIKRHANAMVFVLDEHGPEYTSVKFAALLEQSDGRPIVFVIGGALGFTEQIRQPGFQYLSLSNMTLPHELARVVLYEQLYRVTTIQRGKTYHY